MTPEVAAVVIAAVTVPQLPELARIIAASLKDKRAADERIAARAKAAERQAER